MDDSAGDARFGGSIARMYERLLVPMLFEPFAADLAGRVASRLPNLVLELAAGTGALTRRLALLLPGHVAITATDLNPPMLEQAARTGTARPVSWQQADAMALPFADGSFDLVACQFGAMFFPDKATAFGEARRVLAPGGAFVFNSWDAIGENAFAEVVTDALAMVFPADPPRFMARVPHGYSDIDAIARDLAAAGFGTAVRIDTVSATSRADSPEDVAIAYCHGTPLRNEIEARDPGGLDAATAEVAAALAFRFGTGAIEARMQAHVASAER